MGLLQKADMLIGTKLHPPFIRRELVPRPHLQARITEGLGGPLTLVTAPAGFGKTTLVASCLTGCGMPVAWLSLDKEDNQARRFLTYLVAALHEADNVVGNDATQLMAGLQQVSPEMVLTSLVNELDSIEGEIALVLDDYQFITSPAVHEVVAFLLEHCPGTLHLVIASRSDPPLPVTRLRARGQTVELRAADLRFGEAEAAQFLNDIMGLHLEAGAVELLEERTEGWIAGLQMAALSVQGREDVGSFVREFAGTNRYIMDFMLEEVLAREPEEVQTFLLQTAILTRLSGPLCDAVTGASGGQEMLESLERRNLFVVPLDDERRWYRYHHLFADLLQARLCRSGRDRAAQLLSRAAEWCEQEGQIVEAVGYAFDARDYGRAAHLVSRHWQNMASDGQIETVWSWLNSLPTEVVRNSAPLGAAYCWVLWLMGQMDAIEAHLVDAERALDELLVADGAAGDDAVRLGLPTVLAALRSMVARYHGEFETAATVAERALRLIPGDLPPQVDAQLRALGFLALASARDGAGDLEGAADAYSATVRWSRLSASATGVAGITFRLVGALRLLGRLRVAEQACRDALTYLQTQGMAGLPAAGILHVAMSEVLLERNDLEAAEAHLAQGIELGKRSGRLDALKNAAHVRSRLRQVQQDANGALAAVQEAEAALGEQPAPLARADLLALKAKILLRQGSLSEAARCIEEAVRLAGQDRGQTGQLVALVASRVLLARLKADQVVAQLTPSLAVAEESGQLGVAIELRVLRCLALARQGRLQEAEVDLERALALAEPEGYVRIFVDEGEPVAALLRKMAARPARRLEGTIYSAQYLARLLATLDVPAEGRPSTDSPRPGVTVTAPGTGRATRSMRPTALIEPLSERECQVLRLMAEGLTNEQIAARLIIALGTVKAHIHNISGKLGAQNRAHAVARAKELDLL